jgi:hypothetical protein
MQGGIPSYRKRGGENQNCLQVMKKSTKPLKKDLIARIFHLRSKKSEE